ncbi:hypothetical protein BsWGS_01270 [Bradybaena similaris]
MGTKNAPAIKLWAEFKPMLSVLNILLEFPRTLIEASPRLTIETHAISVETNGSAVVFQLDCLTLRPQTCRGLRWNSRLELHLTLQAELLQNSGENKGGDGDTVKGPHQYSSNQDLLVSKIKACQSHCFCVGCGAQIFKPTCNFRRVLPLPTENWTDFADIWFCHNHQSNGKPHDHIHHSHSGEDTLPAELKKVKVSGFTPRPEDCLVSSLYMLVSARQVESCAVLCTTDRIICKRCGNFLGFVKLGDADSGDYNLHSYFHDPLNGVYKLYFHAVYFGSNLEEVPVHKMKMPDDLVSDQISENNQGQSVEAFISSLLKDQSHLYTSFRFIIDSSSKDESGIVLLLWLLDQELAVFLSSVTSTSALTSESSVPAQSQVTSVSLAACRYMKLLYKVTFLPSNGSQPVQASPPTVFTAWQKDNTVHSISLPYPLCKQFISLLVSSTKQLTRSQRNLNGFHVGYLKVS